MLTLRRKGPIVSPVEIWLQKEPKISHIILFCNVLQKAANYNFGQSLFSRFYKFYSEDSKGQSPIHFLDTQYRMHEDIVKFPNKHIYSDKLLTHPYVISIRIECYCRKIIYFTFSFSPKCECSDSQRYFILGHEILSFFTADYLLTIRETLVKIKLFSLHQGKQQGEDGGFLMNTTRCSMFSTAKKRRESKKGINFRSFF